MLKVEIRKHEIKTKAAKYSMTEADTIKQAITQKVIEVANTRVKAMTEMSEEGRGPIKVLGTLTQQKARNQGGTLPEASEF